MKILIAGFEGNDNSAKILLDSIKGRRNQDVLYLENDFQVSGNQIEEKLSQNYDIEDNVQETFIRKDSRRNFK